ncbi:MAG: hypothetical protein ACHP6I_02965 [Rickettsiales bacterium]
MELFKNQAEYKLSISLNAGLKTDQAKVAAIFNLSRLSESNNNRDHLSIASNILRDQLKSVPGEVYLLSDNDVILIVPSEYNKKIIEAAYQMRFLFSDDLLAFKEDGAENPEFYTVYSGNTWTNFISVCESKIRQAPEEPIHIPLSKALFDLSTLPSRLSRTLENAFVGFDWDKVIKERTICTLTGQGNFQHIIKELAINTANLLDLLKKDEAFLYTAGYQQIKEFLDLRILIKLVSTLNTGVKEAFSLDISLNTLLTEEFRILDEALRENERKNIILTLPLGQVLDRFYEFQIMRDLMKKRGYKIALQDLEDKVFMQIDRNLLGVDLIKLKWQPDLLKQDYENHLNELKNKVQVSGSSRMIFTGCDNMHSIKIGQKLGVALYQGTYIDDSLKFASTAKKAA